MPILTETFESSPGGMNLALAQQELNDTECRYIQDGLVDMPGLLRRRGQVATVDGLATLPARKASGLVSTIDPQGTLRFGVINGDVTNGYFTVFSNDLLSTVDLAWPHELPGNPPTSTYRIVDAKAGLTGGTWIGISSAYDSESPDQGLAYWRGGNKANYTTGTITVARGSASVAGSGTAWNTEVVPGMFLFANTDDPYTSAYVGIVLQVNSATSLTLGAVSPYAATAKSYTLQSLRGWAPRVVKGRITCTTAATAVTGATTKFSSQGLGTGVWQLYRARDMAFIGKVASVESDIGLTLAANAAVAATNERFIAWRADADHSITNTAVTAKVGFLNAVFAERQWYANLGAQFEKTSDVWFSDSSDPEGVDLSTFDGDFIPITSSTGPNMPIKAIQSAYNALLVFKENETFAIFGNSPSTFSTRKLEDDGALSGGSVQPYGGGVIWAGRNGIYFYDGIQVENMAAKKLGDYYKNSIRTFDPLNYRMWSMVAREHYMLFVEKLTPTVGVTKGTTTTVPTRYTIVINMVTRAFQIFTNVHIRGAITLPADDGQKVWYIVNDSTRGQICDSNALFDNVGADEIVCDGGTAGPDFFFESKKFDAGDSLRRKLFKQLAIHYSIQGCALKIDTVVGLNNIGSTSLSEFPATVFTWDSLKASLANWNAVSSTFATWNEILTSVFQPKRVKFLKRSQHLSFRLWQQNASCVRLTLGPFQIGFKLQRPGRV